MNLEITTEQVRNLYDLVRSTQRPAETGLVLTADGWDTEVWTTPSAPHPVALTGEDIYTLLDGEEPDSGDDLDEDLIASLTVPEPGTGERYLVPDEDGELLEPGPGAIGQVVTCSLTNNSATTPMVETMDWADAWWFDLAQARRLLTTLGDHDAYGRDFELWITEGGRYVARRSSSHVAEPGDSWVELTADQAALWLYHAEDDHVDDLDDVPTLMMGARVLRTAAEIVTAPRVPVTDLGITAQRHPERVEGEALRVQETAAALSSLARNVVAPTLARTRREALRILVEIHGQSGTGRLLGVSQPTINNLIK